MKLLSKRIVIAALLFAPFAICQIFAQGTGEEIVKTNETIFSLIRKGGYIMIPIGICSLVALTLFFERMIGLSRKRIVPKDFKKGLADKLEKKEAPLKIFEFCENSPSIIASVIKAGALKWKLSRSVIEIEKNVEDAAFREIGKLRRSLRGLKIIAGVAPMLGLLGTVIGMIISFMTVAQSTESSGKSAKLAVGIYEAMVTTAAGLIIAIPVLLIYYYLLKRVDDYSDDIQVVCNNFLDEMVHQHKEG
jgi:biopolymer transport protein ExbB